MTVWMLPICFGILHLFPFNYGRVFQAQSRVIWSDAELMCQQANGTLFRPDEISFDVHFLEKRKFDGDSWVAATYTFVNSPETNFRMIQPDARDRCIAFEIRQDCTGHYWHKACNETYSMICESYSAPDRQWILGRHMTWVAASDLCQRRSLKLATFIINTRQFFDPGLCEHGFYWTGSVIEVAFQNNTQPTYSQGACGFLHNYVLSFGNCSRMIRPLCKTVEETTLGTRPLHHHYRTSTPFNGQFFSTSTTPPWSTKMTSTSRALTRTTTKRRQTTIRLSYEFSEENVSSSLPTETQMERDIGSTSSHEEKSYLPDIGVIIGSILGGTVFMLIIVLLIIILRKRMSQGTGKLGAAKETTNPKTVRLNKTQNPTYSVDNPNMIVLQHGSTNAEYVSDTRHPEGFNGDVLVRISNPNNSINSFMDSKVDDNNYAKVKTKIITKTSYDSIYLDQDSYDHVEYEKKTRSENVTRNVYDKANFHLRHERASQGNIIYDTTDECSKAVDKREGVYDQANHRLSGDYDTTRNKGQGLHL